MSTPAARPNPPPCGPGPPGSRHACGWTPGTTLPRSAPTSSCGTSPPRGAVLVGQVGVGKTDLACALGHIAIRRRRGVHLARADKLFKRRKAARLDNTLDYEMRRLSTVELLIIDDLALQPLDATSTTDFYELCVERHQKTATIVTSNRTPDEWLPVMADPLLAQSAVDRLVSTAHELIIEGPSYRQPI